MMAQRVLNSRKRSNLYWGKYTLKQPVDLDFIATIVIKIATTTQQMILLTNGNGSNEYEDDRGDKQRSLRGGGGRKSYFAIENLWDSLEMIWARMPYVHLHTIENLFKVAGVLGVSFRWAE